MAQPIQKAEKEDSGRLKWRRTGKPKSRTGCFACKTKRLKCDECHPCCVRCWRSNTVCTYPPPLPSSKDFRDVPQLIALRAAPAKPRLTAFPIYSSISELLRDEGEVENNYVRHFYQTTTSGFEGVMDWSIWSSLVLQFSHQEPFVRDCVIAIGSLLRSFSASSLAYYSNRTFEENQSFENNDVATPTSMAKMHREFAILRYSKAVATMQKVLPSAGPRSIMLACLLVFSFEMMLKNCYSALAHITSGQTLFRQWLSNSHSGPRHQVLLSPAPAQVDDSLVEAFEHLDLQLSTVWDPRSAELHQTILLEGADSLKHMPETFGSLREARQYLHLVMRRSYHFLGASWTDTLDPSLAASFDLNPPSSFTVDTGFNIFSTSYNMPASVHAEQTQYAEDLERWTHAFAPLFQKTRCPEAVAMNDLDATTRRSLVFATLLQLHVISTSISLAGMLFKSQMAYDAFLPQFSEIVSLATVIRDAYNSRPRDSLGSKETHFSAAESIFSLDLGITSPLLLVLLRCRDGRLRRRALELMRGWHAEGVWRPVLVAEFGAFLMEVEEEGVLAETISTARSDNKKRESTRVVPLMGDIPEESRAVLTRVSEENSNNYNVVQGKLIGRRRNESLVQILQLNWKGGPRWRERLFHYDMVGGGEIIVDKCDENI